MTGTNGAMEMKPAHLFGLIPRLMVSIKNRRASQSHRFHDPRPSPPELQMTLIDISLIMKNLNHLISALMLKPAYDCLFAQASR